MPCPASLRLRFIVGHDAEAELAIQRIKDKLRDYQAEIIDEERAGVGYRVDVKFHGDVQKFGYELEEAAKVSSVGESLDIIKDVGGAHDVDHTYHVKNFEGTHGLGHVRLATESDVAPEASHPFWATGFADVAIVHNGQITNYYKLRRRFEKRGYKFNTDNDSELIAVYLADKLKHGSSLKDALRELDRRSRRHLLLPRLHQGRDRLCQGPPGREADGEVRERRSHRHRLGGGVAQPALPGHRAQHIRTAAGDIRDMASIDLSRVSVTQANELIRKYGADGEDIEVINPDARHHIGVGLVHKVKLHIRGSAGYFCAGLTDGPQRRWSTTMSAGAWPTTCSAAPWSCAAMPAPSPASPSAAPRWWCTAISARAPGR